jgi:hypothetical protein
MLSCHGSEYRSQQLVQAMCSFRTRGKLQSSAHVLLFSMRISYIWGRQRGSDGSLNFLSLNLLTRFAPQGFELFSIRDKDIPMEVLELPNKSERVIAFAWEPKGHRFAVVHGDGPRPSVSFYTMRDEKVCYLTGTVTSLRSHMFGLAHAC